MAHQELEFSRRVVRLTRKHRAMSRGCVTRMRPDGLLVTAPARWRPRISLRMVLLSVAAFFAFKVLLLAVAGVATYDERVTRLAAGTSAEQAGAWIMQSDPLTETLAEQILRLMP